ncbi:MAG: DUF2911 domain-containing protein [Ferruginibacter sp.]|nr:DUF2911 domain-containing protein [Bacteroidota bacterium]MBX2917946.1 DUF2911 domain-containing protein [Ferruginibacter sp.]MCB0709178.1 DUF2911 domain-containing protein [Chitinophagaceae bacterium]MCC7379428.1 DUF2911 domain-containing protein [Chitinophagaceae bacterium]
MPVKKPISLLSLIITVSLFVCCTQQANKPVEINSQNRIPVSVKDSLLLSIDKSPMDMIYFPVEYPKQKMITPDMPEPVARVIYSRPQINGRLIFGDTSVTQNVIQYYGHDWRLGANEATEIEFFKPVTINGNKVAAGRYIMYCIPYHDKWKIIFNKNLYSWGLHIDKSKDLFQTELPTINNNVLIEYFTMQFQKADYGCNLVMAWGNYKVILPVNF